MPGFGNKHAHTRRISVGNRKIEVDRREATGVGQKYKRAPNDAKSTSSMWRHWSLKYEESNWRKGIDTYRGLRTCRTWEFNYSYSRKPCICQLRMREYWKLRRKEKQRNHYKRWHEEGLRNKIKLLNQFHASTTKVAGKREWDKLKKGKLIKETKSTTKTAAQDQLLIKNWEGDLRNEQVSPLCGICNRLYKSSENITNKCPTLVETTTSCGDIIM